MCPGLPTRLNRIPRVESGKLFHLVYEVVKLFSYLPFKHVNFFRQSVLPRRGSSYIGISL